MSEVFRCEDKDTLVAYLYGEVDADVRREVERHLRTCAACTREAEGLHAVREDLQLWMPPEAQVGFTITQEARSSDSRPLVPASRWAVLRELPAWAQVAAAALVMAAAAGIANVQVRSGPDGFVVSTGWMSNERSQAAPAIGAVDRSDEQWRAEFAALEQNLRDELREEMRAQQSAIRSTVTSPSATDASDSGIVFRRVQSMIEASEERQRQEMALRFAQAERTWNLRWTNDRAALSRHLGNLQGRTMAVQAGQQEIWNSIRLQRVAGPQPNQ